MSDILNQARKTIAYADSRRADERRECAEIAERIGRELGEPAIGHAIAKAILAKDAE